MEVIKPTHLLHLAWIATPGVYWSSPLNEAWRAASRHLAETFAASGGERIIVTGTGAEYDWSKGVCVEGENDPSPSSPYAKAKLALLQELTELSSAAGISLAWPRMFWTYGPYEPPSRLVPSIILSLLRDEPALCTAGTHRRDMMHVCDVTRAIARMVCSSVAGPINVASGVAPTIASIATTIAAAMNKIHLLRLGVRVPDRPDAPLVVADVSRLENEVGFRPRISLEAGLRETIQWWTERMGHENERSAASSRAPRTQGAGIA
jgi:nucleoside-diphosphate-sugar epimerase